MQHLRDPHPPKAPPNVVYTQLKYMWSSGDRDHALPKLREFTASLANDLQAQGSSRLVNTGPLSDLSSLLGRCYYKLGQWQMELTDDWEKVKVPVLCATAFDLHWENRGMYMIFYNPISWPPTTTLHGIKLGILGRGRTLTSLETWRAKKTTKSKIYQAMLWLLT